VMANVRIIVTTAMAFVVVAFAVALVTSPWDHDGHSDAAYSGSAAIQSQFVTHRPADSQSHQPAEVPTLSTRANHLFDAVGSQNWSTAAGTGHRMSAALAALRAGEVPQKIYTEVNNALESVNRAVRARRARKGSPAALDAAQASVDLQLRHWPTIQVNVSRSELWAGESIAGLQPTA
jgi:hypothetical protein